MLIEEPLKLIVRFNVGRSRFSFLRSPGQVETQVLRTQYNLAALYLFYNFCSSHLSHKLQLIQEFGIITLFVNYLLLLHHIFFSHFFLLNNWSSCVSSFLILLKIFQILQVLSVWKLFRHGNYISDLNQWIQEGLKEGEDLFLPFSEMMPFLVELYDFPQNLQTQIVRKFFFAVEENVHRFQMLFVIAD